MPATHAFAGIRNFRDVGGAPLAGGRRMRRGVLYRSGHFAGATDEDWRALTGLGLSCVVDLRRHGERQRDPAQWPREIACRHVLIEGEHDGDAPHVAFLREGDVTADSARAYMLSAYRRLVYEPAHRAAFSALFEHLAAGEGAAVVHCAAGKDRTGLACALVLETLGAERDAVLTDYLRSNAVLGSEQEVADVVARYGARLGLSLDPEAVLPMLTVSEEYLDAAYDEIAARHGSVEAYLGEWLGLKPDTADALRARLAEAGDE